MILCPKCGLEMVPFPDGSDNGAMLCEFCRTCVRVGPACWDCGKTMHATLRPRGTMWWACSCSRLVPATDVRRWIEASIHGPVPVYMFRHEFEREAS